MASWLVPFLPCWVKSEVISVDPLKNNLSGILCSCSDSSFRNEEDPPRFFFFFLFFNPLLHLRPSPPPVDRGVSRDRQDPMNPSIHPEEDPSSSSSVRLEESVENGNKNNNEISLLVQNIPTQSNNHNDDGFFKKGGNPKEESNQYLIQQKKRYKDWDFGDKMNSEMCNRRRTAPRHSPKLCVGGDWKGRGSVKRGERDREISLTSLCYVCVEN